MVNNIFTNEGRINYQSFVSELFKHFFTFIFSAGFKVTYLGYVHVGKHGDVKQIVKFGKLLLKSSEDATQSEYKKLKQLVFFEIGEIGVKIVDFETSEVSLSFFLLLLLLEINI